MSLAHYTIDAIFPFYSMARIKTLTRSNAVNHFMIFHEEYRKIIKNKVRNNKPEERKRTEFLKDKLFKYLTNWLKDVVGYVRINNLLTKDTEEGDINSLLGSSGQPPRHTRHVVRVRSVEQVSN